MLPPSQVKLKLMMIQDMLFIVTDEHGDGHWNDCVSIPLGLSNMMKAAYIGFSSNTGPRSEKPAQIYNLKALTVYNQWDEAEVGHGQIGHEEMYDPHDEVAANTDASLIDYKYHEGHLDGQAPDLHVAIVTTEEAQKWCTANPSCLSFTQNGGESFAVKAVTTYFKETVTWARNPGWHSYIKSIAPKAVEGISPEKARQLREQRAAEAEAAANAELNVEDTLHKMQLHEWASEQRLEILETKLRDKILEKIALVEEAVKYGMDTALFERLQAIETRMQEQSSDKLTARVQALEERLKAMVEGALVDKVKALEDRVKQSLGRSSSALKQNVNTQLAAKLDALESKVTAGLSGLVNEKIDTRKTSTKEWVDQLSEKLEERTARGLEDVKAHISNEAAVAAQGGGIYLVPCVVLGVVVVAVVIFFYIQYEKLRKTHLL
jgi:hypothetical protein